jgi:hypothetical protein
MNSRVLQMLFVKIGRKRFRIEEDEFYSFVLRKVRRVTTSLTRTEIALGYPLVEGKSCFGLGPGLFSFAG